MARRKSGAPIELAVPHPLSAGLIEALNCPEGKAQAFLRDSEAKGLRVRVTDNGAKSFVFEAKLRGQTLRITIGDPAAWTIEEARKEANRLRVLIDQGIDPRAMDRERAEKERQAAEQARVTEEAQALTVAQAWARYLIERRPHWGARNYADHEGMADAGGKPRKRMKGTTKPGPLAALMPLRLANLDAVTVEAWATREALERPARVRLALRMLKAFLRWAAADKSMTELVNLEAAASKKAREAAGKSKAKDDVLERGQLAAWFRAVQGIPNACTAAYLQTLLLTGARPGEVLTLRWADVNAQWSSITIRDKVEGERQIPLTPFVSRLLAGLPRRNQWVFSSIRAVSLDPIHARRRGRYHAARGTLAPVGPVAQASASGRLVSPDKPHRSACLSVGIEGLTLHGLRRSFASLTEWLDIPAGVVAQIQGHKPSATAEKHYKRRPVDLLRVHHERIEAWILEQAGIPLTTQGVGPKAVVAN